MSAIQSFAIVCLLFCFALSVTVLGLSANYLRYINGPAKHTTSTVLYDGGQNTFLLTPQCLKKNSYYMVLASGIGGTVDAFLIIALLLTKSRYRKASSATVNMVLYVAVAVISVGRSLAAAAWSWSDHARYDPTFDPSTTPINPGSLYPAGKGCFTPETYLSQIAKYIPESGDASHLRSISHQVEAARAITIPLTILYSVVLIAVLVNDTRNKRYHGSLKGTPA
ncbi:MAG: hypothetical protein Q9227_005090 [Pyrenula ochraceoflavens]